jgi:hypothetical protein
MEDKARKAIAKMIGYKYLIGDIVISDGGDFYKVIGFEDTRYYAYSLDSSVIQRKCFFWRYMFEELTTFYKHE